MKEKKRISHLFWMALLAPILMLLIYTPFSEDWDLKTSHFFFQNQHFQDSPFLSMIYNHAIWPGWILVGLSLAGVIASWLFQDMRKWRKPSIYFLLTLAIGSGVLIHGAFKENWGRPRPRQVIEFGGDQPYRPYYSPNFGSKVPLKSFSCGHCSMGFYFFALFFVGLKWRNKGLIWAGLVLSILFGGLLSYARVAQGGHFLSDVILSMLIMWWIALLLAELILEE